MAEIESELRKNHTEDSSYSDLADANEVLQQSKDTKHVFIQLWHGFQNVCMSLTWRKWSRHGSEKGQDLELGFCSGVLNNMEKDHDFLLLCVPFQRYATKLHQAEVCRINSDQELFHVMRHYYFTQRGRSAWTRLRKVCGIEFIMVSKPTFQTMLPITDFLVSRSSLRCTGASLSIYKAARPCHPMRCISSTLMSPCQPKLSHLSGPIISCIYLSTLKTPMCSQCCTAKFLESLELNLRPAHAKGVPPAGAYSISKA